MSDPDVVNLSTPLNKLRREHDQLVTILTKTLREIGQDHAALIKRVATLEKAIKKEQ